MADGTGDGDVETDFDMTSDNGNGLAQGTDRFEDDIAAIDAAHELTSRSHSAPALEQAVRALQQEVAVLKNVIGASFDMQLDIQRSIRQEVSAAMNRTPVPQVMPPQTSTQPPHTDAERSDAQTSVSSSTTSVQTTMDSPTGASSSGALGSYAGAPRRADFKPATSGTCVVCLESDVDAMLYSCGHMCTCAMCGRHLIASGQSCPVCRAPIRDVVRVYMVSGT